MTHSKSILPSPFAHRFCAVDSRLVEVSGFGDGGGLGGAVVVGERVGGSVNRHFFYNKAEHFVHKNMNMIQYHLIIQGVEKLWYYSSCLKIT